MNGSAGNSKEQRDAERWLLKRLSEEVETDLRSKNIKLDESWMELDAFSEDPPVLGEIWAHIGSPKSAQKNKVMKDAIRLLFADKILECESRRILLFACPEAAKPFKENTWMAQCLSELGIEVKIIEPPPEIREMIREAQERQYR